MFTVLLAWLTNIWCLEHLFEAYNTTTTCDYCNGNRNHDSKCITKHTTVLQSFSRSVVPQRPPKKPTETARSGRWPVSRHCEIPWFLAAPSPCCSYPCHAYCATTHSLTHCCAWPAEGRSILHIEQSWLAIWAAPTDRPMSSSTCCNQVLRGRPGRRFQSAVGRVPVWASIDSCSACEAGVFSGRRQMCPNSATTMLINNGVAWNVKLTINSFPWQDFSLIFPWLLVNFLTFPEAVKFPNISRFSRQVVTLCWSSSFTGQMPLMASNQQYIFEMYYKRQSFLSLAHCQSKQ